MDITRGGADKLEGRIAADHPSRLAPPWEILKPVLQAMRSKDSVIVHAGWVAYVDVYTARVMRANRAAMDSLARRGQEGDVTLVCFCKEEKHCHRWLVAQGLVALGCTYAGERPGGAKEAGQLSLFGGRPASPPQPAPRYDEVFAKGQQWLDGLAKGGRDA